MALPILEAIFELEEEDVESCNVAQVAERAGTDLEATRRELQRLNGAGIIFAVGLGWTGPWDIHQVTLTERARRYIGQWPSEDAYESFLAVLASRITEENDPAERSRLEQLRVAVGEVGQAVAGSLLTAYAKQYLGLP